MPAAIPDHVLLEKIFSLNLPTTLHLEMKIIREGRYRAIWGKCDLCGDRKRYHVDNLISRKTTQCKCLRGRKYNDKKAADVIGERFDAMKQRCKEDRKIIHTRYNGRGILSKFINRKEYVDYVFCLLKEKYSNHKGSFYDAIRRHDVDRINNNGHYEPGNLRLVRRSENLKNREGTHRTLYEGRQVSAVELWHLLIHDEPSFSFSIEYTSKLARRGFTGEEILKCSLSRRYGGRKVTRIVRIDENILIKHGKLPMPTSWKERGSIYFERCGKI